MTERGPKVKTPANLHGELIVRECKNHIWVESECSRGRVLDRTSYLVFTSVKDVYVSEKSIVSIVCTMNFILLWKKNYFFFSWGTIVAIVLALDGNSFTWAQSRTTQCVKCLLSIQIKLDIFIFRGKHFVTFTHTRLRLYAHKKKGGGFNFSKTKKLQATYCCFLRDINCYQFPYLGVKEMQWT